MMTANLSNLRQVQLGLLMYADDNKTSMPWSEFQYPGTGHRFWGGMICTRGYIPDPRTFWSPFRVTSGFDMALMRNSSSDLSWNSTGYSVNSSGVMPVFSNASGLKPLRIGQKRAMRPSDVLTATEAFAVYYYSINRDGRYRIAVDDSEPLFTWQGQSVQAYLDGHVIRSSSRKIGWQATDDRHGAWIAPYGNSGYPWYSQLQSTPWDTYYNAFYTQN